MSETDESAYRDLESPWTPQDPRVVRLADRFGIAVRLVVEDLDELERWRHARATRPIVPWLAARHGWDEDGAHYYLAALERL